MRSSLFYPLFHVKHHLGATILLLLLILSGSLYAQECQAIRNAMAPFMNRGSLPGYVAVIGNQDNILAFEAQGVIDLDSKIPVSKETMFWIASMTKPVTAVAVMILVDEGKLSLDDPVSKFIPEFNHLWVCSKKSDNDILLVPAEKSPTLRQVLSHTGGFEFFTPYMGRVGIDSLPMERLALSATMFPLKYQPGKDYQYSNTGIDIAAAVLEKVSGQKLEDFMQKRIFDPLKMKNTTFFPNQDQLKRLVTPYTWDKKAESLKAMPRIWCLNLPYNDSNIRFAEAGGGLFATAEDCFHFYQMLVNDGIYQGKRILSKEAIKEITKDQTGLKKNYGLGMNVQKEYYGHGGAYGTNASVTENGKRINILMIQLTDVPDLHKIHNAFNRVKLN